MLDIFRTLYHMALFIKDSSNEASYGGPSKQELIKTANLLFAQLETSYVWTCCGEQFDDACGRLSLGDSDANFSFNGEEVGAIGSGPPTVVEMCKIIKFLLDVVSIETYVETSSEHLPTLFQVMVKSITKAIETINGQVLHECLITLRKVLQRVQPAWNVWDVTDKVSQKTVEITETDGMDIARE